MIMEARSKYESSGDVEFHLARGVAMVALLHQL